MPKPIFFILVALVIAIAVTFYVQKQGAEKQLKKLIANGTVVVDEYINALPIVIIDNTHQQLHLLSGEQHQALAFASIKEIKLYEAIEKGNNASEKIGPDYGTITTNFGELFRFGNLEITADALYNKLQQNPALTSKLQLINSR